MSHENANALRSIGVNCQDYTLELHPFEYATQSKKITAKAISRMYRQFDVIQVFHSDAAIYSLVKDHPNVVVYHTGTRYRNDKDFYDQLFEGRLIITDQCEFLLHNPFFHYLAPHTTLKPYRKPEGNLIIGHYPSNPVIKGTKEIRQVLSKIKGCEIRIDEKRVTHNENLKRVSECHVYIELFKPIVDRKPYGCFGVSAFEAAAMGGIVITNNINPDAYTDVYGQQPFFTPNTLKDLERVIRYVVSNYEKAKEILEGFNEKHSIQATGTRIYNLIR